MATAAISMRRARPEDGGIVWHAPIHAFECLGCGDFEELRKRRQYDDPEFLARTKELLILDHTECWEFADPRMARDARRHRKEKKRRELVGERGLAAQRVGWRGTR